MLELFKDYWACAEKHEPFYVTGPAGSGKTYSLAELTEYLQSIGVKFVVCAYTHDACNVLRGKLNSDVEVRTLHSVLRKRPTINDSATKSKHIERSRQCGTPDIYEVIVVDEYYMVGEQDHMDIVTTCEDEEGETITRMVYVGDMNQLPPVGDESTIEPQGKWWVKLTKIWRQESGNELLDLLCNLVSYIEGTAQPKPLLANANFIRNVDLVEQYHKLKKDTDPILLAYTNQRVEELNALVQGRDQPKIDDLVFSPTTRRYYNLTNYIDDVFYINKAFGDDLLTWGSKYKTLEHLKTMPDIQYLELETLKDGMMSHAVVFGHYQYKIYLGQLKEEAAAANLACKAVSSMENIRMWAQLNNKHPAAKRRAKAWRNYLTFKECVICLDFPHAKTVHKSQGSTYEDVLVDTQDLHICASRNFNLYLRLLYVAISRASNKVYTN